jgi:hypothetical protein
MCHVLSRIYTTQSMVLQVFVQPHSTSFIRQCDARKVHVTLWPEFTPSTPSFVKPHSMYNIIILWAINAPLLLQESVPLCYFFGYICTHTHMHTQSTHTHTHTRTHKARHLCSLMLLWNELLRVLMCCEQNANTPTPSNSLSHTHTHKHKQTHAQNQFVNTYAHVSTRHTHSAFGS